MRELIFVDQVADMEETVDNLTITSLPQTFGPKLLIDMFGPVEAEDAGRNIRRAVFVSADLASAFSANGFENMFDPIERVADLVRGNIGSVLGYQVVRVDNVPAVQPVQPELVEGEPAPEPIPAVPESPAYIAGFPNFTLLCVSLVDNEGEDLKLHDIVAVQVNL